jgi:hypothetical protein
VASVCSTQVPDGSQVVAKFARQLGALQVPVLVDVEVVLAVTVVVAVVVAVLVVVLVVLSELPPQPAASAKIPTAKKVPNVRMCSPSKSKTCNR